MEEFIKWCFKNQESSIMTLIIIGAIFGGIIGIIRALKGNSNDDDDDDE